MGKRSSTRLGAAAALLMASIWWMSLGGGCLSQPRSVPAPSAGVPEYQELGLVPIPGGQLNVAGGNLVVRRTDLDIDTRLGPLAVGQVWNAATRQWYASFAPSYAGGLFVDETGASFSIASHPDGSAIPGTTWVKLGAQTLRTKGGRVHEFDAGGRLTSVRWASADHPRLSYVWQTIAGAQRLARIDQCSAASTCSAVYSLSYDVAGRLVAIADRAGRSAAYAYDSEDRLVSARDGLDVARGWSGFRYAYDAAGRLAALTNSEGERIEYAYDGNGRLALARAIGLGNPSHGFAYSVAGSEYETRVTDPTGTLTRYVWNAGRSVTRIVNAAGDATHYMWSGLRPIRMQQPDGAVTTWSWVDDDVASETQPSGNVLLFAYQASAVDREEPRRRPLARLADSLGVREQRSYDGSGRLLEVGNGAGEITRLAYATDQSLASLTLPSGQLIGFSAYGEHGHPTRVTSGGQTDERVYDTVGNLLSGGQPAQPAGPGNPGIVARGFDEDRNLASLQLAGLDLAGSAPQGTITLGSRSDRRRVSIARPHGDDSLFVYDMLGHFVERRDKVDGVFESTLVTHDAAGRRTSRERPNGMREFVGYDAAGRIQSLAYQRGGVSEASAQLSYAAGRVTSQLDSTHATPETYEWDGAGRLARVRFPGGEAIEREYDLRGRTIRETLRRPDGSVLLDLDLEYDGADRLIAVSGGGVTLLSRSFTNGQLRQERYGNGLTRLLYWNASTGHLSSAVLQDAQGGVVESTSASREPCSLVQGGYGSPCVWTETTSASGVAATTHELHGLSTQAASGGRRLAESQWGHGFDDLADGYWTYGYDELGNLTRVADDETSLSLVYNAERNRLLEVQDQTGTLVDYAWDAAGFATARAGVPLAWTAQGRIASIGGAASFAWDTLGRPRQATLLGASRHFRFGGRVYGPTPGSFAVADYGPFVLDLLGGEDRYRHLDFRGNVKLVTDEAGAVVTHYVYSGYGVEELHGEAGDGTSFAQGRELGGLVLIGLRVLDPLAGRFLSPDPVYQLVNQFAYADGNPIEFWDPSGATTSWSVSGSVEFKMDITKGGKGIEGGVALSGTISSDGKDGSGDGSGGDGSGGDSSGGGAAGDGGSGSGSGSGSVDTGGGGSGGGGSGGGGGGGCSPAELARTPDLGPALAVLLPIQLALGAWLLRRRRAGR